MLYGLLTLVSLIATVFFIYQYFGNRNVLFLILGIVFLIATVGLGGFFLSGRVNRKEDIHITE
jgi:hypothetical protein